MVLKCFSPPKAQQLSSIGGFPPRGWERGDGGSREGDLSGHPQSVPVKMSQRAFMFALSPADCWVFASQSKSCLSGCGFLRQHPQKRRAVGTSARGGLAELLGAWIHGQGNRKQAEKREEHPGALCDGWWGESGRFCGPCIMQIAWYYVKPLCSSSPSRAKSSVGPGQFAGRVESAAAQMVTPGLWPPEEDLPVPQSLQASSFLALWRQIPALGSPARIQHQATAQLSPASVSAPPGVVANVHLRREELGMSAISSTISSMVGVC